MLVPGPPHLRLMAALGLALGQQSCYGPGIAPMLLPKLAALQADVVVCCGPAVCLDGDIVPLSQL